MFSKRSREGYLLIDHRAGDGTDIVRGRSVFEAATITCSHCQRQFIRNPARTRERCWCSGCDHYICDQCGELRAQTGVCRPFKKIMDDYEKQVIQQEKING